MSLIGAELLREEDVPLLTGRARFVADVDREGQLYARVVRSPFPHGILRGVEAGAARERADVLAVLTADDLPNLRIPIRLPFAETPEANRALQPPLARDRVRYVGEPVALVLAADPYVAEDAAELVEIDVHELEPLVDVRAAASDEAERLHAEVPNLVSLVTMRHGDVDAAFAAADVVVRERIEVHRHASVPMETRGLVAEFDRRTSTLTVWGAAKVKHFNRRALAALLGLDPERVRLVEVNVGGGFGARGELYPEDVLIPYAAMRLERPVKWIEDRYEHLLATNHSREQAHEMEVAATRDGILLAYRDRGWCDQGAYIRTQGVIPAVLVATHLPGPYGWRAFETEAAAVLTNRTPVGTFRAPGVTEAAFVRERMVDIVARELGLDPVELRRRNLIGKEEIPHTFALTSGPPIVYESGDFPDSFRRLLDAAGYDELRAEQRARRERGETIGLGVSTFMEGGAAGPFEVATIEPTVEGTFVVRVGASSLGQGLTTSLGQIAAESLRVPFAQVEVRYRDTDEGPEGFGAFASRTTVLCGNAIALAAQHLRLKAAELSSQAEEEVDLVAEAPALAADDVRGEGRFEKTELSFSFGASLALVRIDSETGRARVLRYLVAYDVGRAINPGLVRGQLAGAAAQGIAGALFEELAYDDYGQPLATSFVDYLMPTATDVPDVEVIVLENPTPANPLGVKGSGEGGIAGALAALGNAVADALGPDVSVTRPPFTPAAIRALLRARS